MLKNSLAKDIEKQPINAGFFNQSMYLHETITPGNLQVQTLYEELNKDAQSLKEGIFNCWDWVARQVRYVMTVSGTLNIEGKASSQNDIWMAPNLVISTKVGNCFNKSALLMSLVRNALPKDDVSLVIGNLLQGEVGGHAWVICNLDDQTILLESTQPAVRNPFVLADDADIYEPIIYTNDVETAYIENRQLREPLGLSFKCVSFLEEYLNQRQCSSYI